MLGGRGMLMQYIDWLTDNWFNRMYNKSHSKNWKAFQNYSITMYTDAVLSYILKAVYRKGIAEFITALRSISFGVLQYCINSIGQEYAFRNKPKSNSKIYSLFMKL